MLGEFDLLTLDHVARMLHVSKAHVSNVVAGPIPVLHLGRRKLVRRATLELRMKETIEQRYRQNEAARAHKERIMRSRSWAFGEFVEQVYLPFYSRKWKHSTRGSSDNRIALHTVEVVGSNPTAPTIESITYECLS